MDHRSRRRLRPRFERLEGRACPATDFTSAFAIGATGAFADIKLNAVALDESGNAFVTGSFRGTVDFDPGTANVSQTSQGNRDAFVASYSLDGSLRWVSIFAGANAQAVGQGSAIGIDAAGRLYVTGTFNGTVDFDPGPTASNLAAPSRNDIFVARLDGSGGLTWARSVAGSEDATDAGLALAIDATRGVVVGGSFDGSATFGASLQTAAGSSEAFVTKLDPSGTFLWTSSTRGAGNSTAEVRGLTVDATGKVFAVGFVSGTVDFDPGPGDSDLTSNGIRDVAVWALDATGGLAWTKGMGGTDVDQAQAVALDGTGNLNIVGSFSGTVDFNPGPATLDLTATGLFDPFLLKMSPSGATLAAYGLSLSSDATGEANGIAIDGAGNVYASGWFGGTLDADPGAGRRDLASAGSADVFVVALDPSGSLLDARRGGSANFDASFGLALDGSGRLALAGTSTGPATFGATTIQPVGSSSVFVGRLLASHAPASPAAPQLQSASDTGASPTDAVTSDNRPTFDLTGVAPGIEARLLRDGVVVASRVGPGAISDPGPAADGVRSYTAVQVIGSAPSSPSPVLSVTIDTVAPASSSAPALSLASDSGTLGDRRTNVRRPTLVGSAEPASTVTLRNSAGSVLGTAFAGLDGNYAIMLSTLLADGTYTLNATASDLAGNASGAASSFITIDATAPAAPSALTLLTADDSGTKGDRLTNVRRPRITGSAEPLSSVRLIDASGALIAQGQASLDATFALTPNAKLPEGAVSLRVIATDAAGNASLPSVALALRIDSTAAGIPTALALVSADDSGTAGDRITNVRQPRYTGRAEAGSSIIMVGVAGTTTAAPDGIFTIRPTGPLADGFYQIAVVATDAAGNTSAASVPLGLTIDSTPPSAPTNFALVIADDSGTVGDSLTNVRQPRLAGRAEAGSVITLVGIAGSTTVAGDGSFVLIPSSPLADGTYALSVRATDSAGNVSPNSAAIQLRILTAPPAAPTLAIFGGDDTGVVGDRVTAVRRPRFSGNSVVGGTVELLNASGSVIGTTVVGPDGTFLVSPSPAFGLGFTSVSARVRDPAGNLGDAGPRLDLRVITPLGDFSGAGVSSYAVFDPRNAIWTTLTPGASSPAVRTFGVGGRDRPFVDDFDGDGRADYVAFRPATAEWSIFYSRTQTSTVRAFGWAGVDLPIPADFDGDGKADFAVFRPPTGEWIVSLSAGGSIISAFGAANLDLPMPADYDGDGRADLAVYRPTTAEWLIRKSGDGGGIVQAFGWSGVDLPIPADYDGDGKADIAVFRPPTAEWFIRPSGGVINPSKAFGWAGVDLPVPADYDGDGKTDIAVFRPPTAEFFSTRSGGGSAPPTVVGQPGIATPVLRPQIYRLDGLNPRAASVPAALVVARFGSPPLDVPAGPPKVRAATVKAPVAPMARPLVRPAQSLPGGRSKRLSLGLEEQ